MNMIKNHKSKICKLSIIMISLFFLTACSNTLEGLGRDIENTGEKIQETF